MRKALSLIALIAGLLATVPALAAELAGRASVIDGDTIEIHGKRVRLFGIDAPEAGQLCDDARGKAYRCGQRAALALADKIGAGTVACEQRDVDRYKRIVAVCRLEGFDVGAWMVSEGWALDYARYSGGRYASEEAEAKAARRGLWAGAFVAPWEWRRGLRWSREAGGRHPVIDPSTFQA